MFRTQLKNVGIWFQNFPRKPLIIRGARQVGKSTLVRNFAASNSLLLHEINLEQHKELRSVFMTNNPARIFQDLQLIIGKGNIINSGSLLFIDEIQAIPEALEALRYLHEEAPSLPIIAAGSLLEFSLREHEYSMPVGRVEYLFMGPLTFEEFLQAAGENSLLDYIKQFQIKDKEFSTVAHNALLDLYRLFCVVGGMPEVVEVFFRTKDFAHMRKIQASLVTTYRDDFAKYAKGADLTRLHKMLDYISVSLGEKIKYSNVDPDEKSIDLKKALFLLHRAQVVDVAYHSSGSSLSLRSQANFKIFKPFYLDCGLIAYMLGLYTPIAQLLSHSHEGKLAEQFVAQHLLTLSEPQSRPELYYWLREGKNSNAEVDFLISRQGQVLPIEVKSGTAGTLKSLHQFVAARNSQLAVRFSQHVPDLSQVSFKLTHQEGKVDFRLLSLPFYLIGELERLLGDVL